MSSSAKHHLAAAATSDKQKDGSSSSAAASTTASKEQDTASRVSEQLVKQVEVNYSPDFLVFYCSSMQQDLC